MLTALEIEYFKGIGPRQRIEFAPLTLLFGANSAGKSTILQALLYLHELIERGSADVDRTELGGDLLRLGGFRRLVNHRSPWKDVALRVEFATPGNLGRFTRDLSDFPFPDLDDDIESAWLELTIGDGGTPTLRGPIVTRAVIGVNKNPERLVSLNICETETWGELLEARVNFRHPLIADQALDVLEAWRQIRLSQDEVWIDEDAGEVEVTPVFAVARARQSAMPGPGVSLRVIPFIDGSVEGLRLAEQISTFLELVVLGTTAQLSAILRDAVYVGPLRTIPSSGFLHERAGGVTSWADGLAAWSTMIGDRGTLVERTNGWLRRLGAGCQIVVQQLTDVTQPRGLREVDKTARRLVLDADTGAYVVPSEVGVGISQLIPVVVAALDGRSELTLVEQPELHIHPALQVALGDLFIEQAASRQFIIETHSEHLILRILRRIRETTAGELPAGAPAFDPSKLSVLYVEAGEWGTTIRRLGVDATGEFTDPWPAGFFEERAGELF